MTDHTPINFTVKRIFNASYGRIYATGVFKVKDLKKAIKQGRDFKKLGAVSSGTLSPPFKDQELKGNLIFYF